MAVTIHKKSGSYSDDFETDGQVPIAVLAAAAGIIDQTCANSEFSKLLFENFAICLFIAFSQI